MPRCGDCNKFVSLEAQDPEVGDLAINGGAVTAAVRIINACADCGTELREAQLELEEDVTERLAGHLVDPHELGVTEESIEATERVVGKGRGAKTFYGARVEVSITCSCQTLDPVVVTIEGDIQASHMDDA